MLKKNRFAIENLHPFDGYHQSSDLWNGWEKPYFEWGVAQEIVKWNNEWNGNKQLEADPKNQVIVDWEDPEQPFEIAGEKMITEDGEKVLYSLGTGWWIWDIFVEE